MQMQNYLVAKLVQFRNAESVLDLDETHTCVFADKLPRWPFYFVIEKYNGSKSLLMLT
jgi:hypothetical protein